MMWGGGGIKKLYWGNVISKGQCFPPPLYSPMPTYNVNTSDV